MTKTSFTLCPFCDKFHDPTRHCLSEENNALRARVAELERRLEAIRSLTTTKHETLAQFVSRVRSCLYQDHF